MSLDYIKYLVHQGEGERIEFKRKVAYPEKIIREIVAFANTKGGTLIIGVDDYGNIPGLKFAEEELYYLNNTIEKYCRPEIAFTSELVALNQNKAIISYHIPEGTNKPHYVLENLVEQALERKNGFQKLQNNNKVKKLTPKQKRWGRAYIRVGDQSLKASKEVWQILKRRQKEENIQFFYGKKEKRLMEYLGEHDSITLTEFAEIANLPRYHASKTLVMLVLANVLKIVPKEKEDIYILKESVT